MQLQRLPVESRLLRFIRNGITGLRAAATAVAAHANADVLQRDLNDPSGWLKLSFLFSLDMTFMAIYEHDIRKPTKIKRRKIKRREKKKRFS